MNEPQFSLDFDLDSEHGLDVTPTERPANIGYGIAGLEEGTGMADGQGIALVVDAEVSTCSCCVHSESYLRDWDEGLHLELLRQGEK